MTKRNTNWPYPENVSGLPPFGDSVTFTNYEQMKTIVEESLPSGKEYILGEYDEKGKLVFTKYTDREKVIHIFLCKIISFYLSKTKVVVPEEDYKDIRIKLTVEENDMLEENLEDWCFYKNRKEPAAFAISIIA